MKIKTSELIGIALDYAVAMAEGLKLYNDTLLDGRVQKGWMLSGFKEDPNSWVNLVDYRPSTDWKQGGPIIDRGLITTSSMFFEKDGWKAWQWTYWAQAKHEAFGSTPLIAAMRCYVKSKLGDEVEIPDGIQ